MILIIDSEVFYLEQAKEFSKKRGMEVITAHSPAEFFRLFFNFHDRITVIFFDPARVQIDPALIRGIQHVSYCFERAKIEWRAWNQEDSRTSQAHYKKATGG